LTKADEVSHNIIVNGLKKYNIPILSEEGKNIPYEERKNWKLFWLIDPLDGTKEFIKRNGEFTVNIALIYNNSPIFGVVYAPVIDTIYFNDEKDSFRIKNSKLEKLPIKQERDTFVVVASKSHLNNKTQKFIEKLSTINKRPMTTISKGSSLKLCLVAEGSADIYPRLAPTMEWDTAAADAIVRKAGKMTYQFESNQPMVYNKENLLNPWFII
jgi:3'(2'), 5'-bisphosphate nucleotidase